MNTITKVFIVAIMATLMMGCGSCEKFYDKQNYESITNETGILTLWSGGKVMAVFHEAKIVYSAADSDAIYFQDVKGSNITLTKTNGETYSIEGTGDTWYNSPGVLLQLED